MILNLVRGVAHVAVSMLALYAAHRYGTGAQPAELWLCVAFAAACLLMLAGAGARLDRFLQTSDERKRRDT